MMDQMKGQIIRSFRMEMMGTGIYRSFAAQYGNKNAELAERFLKFSQDEYMHGKLFAKLFLKHYGEMIRGEGFWIFMGRVMALLMRALPLEKKMKKLSIIESQAVKRIQRELPGCENPGLTRIMKTILPDEMTHAGLYGEWFAA
jgi:rubrerythrin